DRVSRCQCAAGDELHGRARVLRERAVLKRDTAFGPDTDGWAAAGYSVFAQDAIVEFHLTAKHSNTRAGRGGVVCQSRCNDPRRSAAGRGNAAAAGVRAIRDEDAVLHRRAGAETQQAAAHGETALGERRIPARDSETVERGGRIHVRCDDDMLGVVAVITEL